MARFKVENHNLVPKHSKLAKEEIAAILERFHITLRDLPKINYKDPGIANLNVKENDVIRIERKSPTAGTALFYRRVSRD